MVRDIERLNLGLKHTSSGIIRHNVIAFIFLHFVLLDTRVLNSFIFALTYIYIYTQISRCGYLQVRGAYDKFRDVFRIGIYNCHSFFKIHYVIAIHLMRWLTNFDDFSFKWTATAVIGIHPTKAWLSQLVNFKNAMWPFRRTICNKIVF